MTFQDTYPTFEDYMLTVNHLIQNALLGLSSADIDDYDYASDYDDKISPVIAAREAIRATLKGQ